MADEAQAQRVVARRCRSAAGNPVKMAAPPEVVRRARWCAGRRHRAPLGPQGCAAAVLLDVDGICRPGSKIPRVPVRRLTKAASPSASFARRPSWMPMGSATADGRVPGGLLRLAARGLPADRRRSRLRTGTWARSRTSLARYGWNRAHQRAAMAARRPVSHHRRGDGGRTWRARRARRRAYTAPLWIHKSIEWSDAALRWSRWRACSSPGIRGRSVDRRTGRHVTRRAREQPGNIVVTGAAGVTVDQVRGRQPLPRHLVVRYGHGCHRDALSSRRRR